MRKIFFLPILIVLNLLSCSVNTKQQNFQQKEIQYELILMLKENSVQTDQEIEIITNIQDFTKIYKQLNLTRFPGIPIPKIDFEENSILVINKKLSEDIEFTDIALDKIIQNKKCIKVSTKLDNTTMNISNKNRVLKLYKIPKIETSICN
ncbi:hypothetical protein HX096_07780 [Empedobacter falsenii]|uniref:hypothetical protein n=1 Tax=Empedobacter falsenii TaxID=343874 RepID=UPI00257701E6|nr:hypothetical protein [Empedobacter falsenii]MDM1547758.1 hypothetical protein [Empedobacter falsenii]